MPSEYKSRHLLQKSIFYSYWSDTKVEEMHRPWNTPVIKSLMWILPCSCFLLEAGTKKNLRTHPHTHLSTFFLMRQLSAPALISEEETEFPKTLAEQILKIVARRHEMAVNPFLEGLLWRLLCFHSQLSSISKCNLFGRCADFFRTLKSV